MTAHVYDHKLRYILTSVVIASVVVVNCC